VFDRRSKAAFVVACLTLAGCAMGFQWAVEYLNVFLKKKPVELRASFSTIPDVIGAWKKLGKDSIFDEAMVESLGTHQYLNRAYAMHGNPSKGLMTVHVAYYTGLIDAVPHVADRCMEAAGHNAKTLPENIPLAIDMSTWRDDPECVNRRTGKPYPTVLRRHHFTGQWASVHMPVGDLALRTTEFERDDDPAARVYAGYLFIANGRTTPTPDAVRLLAFDKTDEYAYYCKVQFTMSGSQGFNRDQFVQQVSGFVSDFLPELMRCLPDWAEVESRGHTEPAVETDASTTR
jgi:hypothetical protein